MTSAQDLPIALPTSSRKFSPYLVSGWKGCGEAGTFAERWWSCSELCSSGTEILARHSFFGKFSLRTAGKWGAKVFRRLNHSLWDSREFFFPMSGFKPCRSTSQLHSYSKIFIQVVHTTKNVHIQSKTTVQLRWVTLRGYKLCLYLRQSIAYNIKSIYRIQLLINLILGWLCQIFFKRFWFLEHYFFTFPATLKFFRGVQYSRVMKLFSEGITWLGDDLFSILLSGILVWNLSDSDTCCWAVANHWTGHILLTTRL